MTGNLSENEIIDYGRLVLNFQVQTCIYLTSLLDTYHVNVTPDKRSILLYNEGSLILALKL
jgi:hypothetical protein